MDTFAVYSYTFSTVAYFLLLCVSLIRANRNLFSLSVIIAVGFSTAWGAYTVYVLQNDGLYIQDTLFLESLRNLAWFYFLSVLIAKQQLNSQYFLLRKSWQVLAILFVSLVIVILECFTKIRYQFQELIGFDFRLFAHIAFSIVGMMLVEQVYRNAMPEQRWANKFLCLGLASIFTFDFVLYSKSLLFNTLDSDLWDARGIINGLIVPLIGISLNRLSKQKIRVKISNNLIFHTTILLGAGSYLLLMSFAGYYIKVYGGNWGAIAQISFIFLAIVLLLVFFVSGKIRALAKVYFSKHFFQHRYDYREEWLKLSKNLAELNSVDELSNFLVDTMANIVDSSGGGVWIKNEQGDFYLRTEHNLGAHTRQVVRKDEGFLNFLSKKQWVVDFVEFFYAPDIYADSGLDQWFIEMKEIWLMIPLFQNNSLEAFVVLTKPKVSRQIDWEDHDLLKTVGMQIANALALTKASEELSRARQFEVYNQFSAFLVHDLKNLVAQISLIVKNSEKHKRNPEFIDDSIETLENVVSKIEHILGQLKKGNILETTMETNIDLIGVLKDVEEQQASNKPKLELEINAENLFVMGDNEKLIAILGHLVQNAQEATPEDGFVKINVTKQQDKIVIKIIDSGCGMDEKFIQDRLYRPFDTTKGNAGMGIGVYEAREYVLHQKGEIMVQSSPGKGTMFTVTFPAAIR